MDHPQPLHYRIFLVHYNIAASKNRTNIVRAKLWLQTARPPPRPKIVLVLIRDKYRTSPSIPLFTLTPQPKDPAITAWPGQSKTKDRMSLGPFPDPVTLRTHPAARPDPSWGTTRTSSGSSSTSSRDSNPRPRPTREPAALQVNRWRHVGRLEDCRNVVVEMSPLESWIINT